MRVLTVFTRFMKAAMKLGMCARRYKWPIVSLLLVAPLAITWSPEVFALNGLGLFSWFLLVRHVLKLMGRR